LQNVLKFEIEYRITDPLKVNEFKNEKITVSYDSLLNGFDLHLNKNQNNKYLFQLINVSCLEISTPELFIQRSSTKNITNGSLQIGLTDNNFYELLPPKIANIEFKNSDSSNLNNIYPSSLDDMEIFRMFVTLIDTYGMRDDYSLLTNDMYQIQRDDVNGTIEININVDNIRINKIYDGFKRTTNQSYELDASKAAFNIIPDELDNEEINEIFIANGFSQPIVQSSTFKVMDIDDIKGIANIKITSGPLMDKCYKIANLQPYYIKVKDKIDKKYLTINPSKIDTQSLKSNYLDISNEFLSRNQDSLSFILDSNNEKKILVVHVSYYEDFDSKFIKTDLTINFASRKNIN
jgi:hypothetical protein